MVDELTLRDATRMLVERHGTGSRHGDLPLSEATYRLLARDVLDFYLARREAACNEQAA